MKWLYLKTNIIFTNHHIFVNVLIPNSKTKLTVHLLISYSSPNV